MQKNPNKKVLAGVLIVLCLVIAAVLLFCTDTLKPQGSGGAMKVIASEETVEANTAFFLAHFEEIELSEVRVTREYQAMCTARALGKVLKTLMVSASTEAQQGGGAEVTVIDEEGNTYIFYINSFGGVEYIEDEDGNYIYARLM
ncbi:MAG: hypothetical protein FWE41_07950 [Coriobacteriia bacterium]|nr:hypothetical protein [Coriobacteriia bacterium]MCL2750580.1 hypothetical protein [Coriobacteriia bacterium]